MKCRKHHRIAEATIAVVAAPRTPTLPQLPLTSPERRLFNGNRWLHHVVLRTTPVAQANNCFSQSRPSPTLNSSKSDAPLGLGRRAEGMRKLEHPAHGSLPPACPSRHGDAGAADFRRTATRARSALPTGSMVRPREHLNSSELRRCPRTGAAAPDRSISTSEADRPYQIYDECAPATRSSGVCAAAVRTWQAIRETRGLVRELASSSRRMPRQRSDIYTCRS